MAKKTVKKSVRKKSKSGTAKKARPKVAAPKKKQATAKKARPRAAAPKKEQATAKRARPRAAAPKQTRAAAERTRPVRQVKRKAVPPKRPGVPLSDLVARDVMDSDVLSIPAGMSIGKAAALLSAEEVGIAPVVDDYGKLVGVISETDILRQEMENIRGAALEKDVRELQDESGILLNDGFQLDTSESDEAESVQDIMTVRPATAMEGTPLKDICALMAGNQINYLVVISRGRVSGAVSAFDVLRAVGGTL